MARRWSQLSEERLLGLRLCDLPLRLERSVIPDRMERLYAELEAKGLRFRPHYWLAEEWFTPDGVPGIAVPFYLAHDRLMKLERKFMLESEGTAENECMRILRHEAGHAIDNAYRLHRRKRWRELFGSFAAPYPEWYRPRPHSRDYVQHLRGWYAQAHPAEDFAETFAVWLTPGYPWRRRYAGWDALKKLEYVDELMGEIAGRVPPVRNRLQIEPLRQVRKTLADHYRLKRDTYAVDWPGYYDRDLRRVFAPPEAGRVKASATVFLRRHRRDLCATVAEAAGVPPYTVDCLLQSMIERCRSMKLVLRDSSARTRERLLLVLAVHTGQFAHAGYFPIIL